MRRTLGRRVVLSGARSIRISTRRLRCVARQRVRTLNRAGQTATATKVFLPKAGRDVLAPVTSAARTNTPANTPAATPAKSLTVNSSAPIAIGPVVAAPAEATPDGSSAGDDSNTPLVFATPATNGAVEATLPPAKAPSVDATSTRSASAAAAVTPQRATRSRRNRTTTTTPVRATSTVVPKSSAPPTSAFVTSTLPNVTASTSTSTSTSVVSTIVVTTVALTSVPSTSPPETTSAPPATTAVAPTTSAPTTSAPTTTLPTTTSTAPAPILPPSAGRVFVISPSGNDANPGTAALPRRTVPAIQNGDTVYFRAGTYTGVSLDWTDVVGVRLLAFPNETPVFDGGYQYGQFIVLRDGVANVTIAGLTITHYDNAYGNGAIDVNGAVSNTVVENNLFDANGSDPTRDHHIYLGSGSSLGRISGFVIRNNTFRNAVGGSIHSFGTTNAVNVIVENNRFVGGRWGVLISDEGQSDWDIRNNTFVGATDSAGAFGYYTRAGRADVVRIRLTHNVIVAAPGAFALRVDAPQVRSGALVDQGNIFWASGGGASVLWGYPSAGQSLHVAGYQAASGQGAQTTEVDPQIVDNGGSDVRPRSGSAVGFGAS